MKNADGRTKEQIRDEIGAERAQLNAALATIGAEAKRSGRIAGSTLTALAGAFAGQPAIAVIWIGLVLINMAWAVRRGA